MNQKSADGEMIIRRQKLLFHGFCLINQVLLFSCKKNFICSIILSYVEIYKNKF